MASTFPFNRRDGVVTEVLMLDTSPDALLVTMQNRRPPPTSVRLQGATVKVWTSRALCSQRPLMVIHDVVKHMQLETGKVFMWRLVGDACVPIVSGRCVLLLVVLALLGLSGRQNHASGFLVFQPESVHCTHALLC